MTRVYAAMALLALGPLPRAEFIDITGWERKRADQTLQYLRDKGLVGYRGTTQKGVYYVSQVQLKKEPKC